MECEIYDRILPRRGLLCSKIAVKCGAQDQIITFTFQGRAITLTSIAERLISLQFGHFRIE